jgi:hypothetical protein
MAADFAKLPGLLRRDAPTVSIGHAALDVAVANFPNELFTLRNRAMVIRPHPPDPPKRRYNFPGSPRSQGRHLESAALHEQRTRCHVRFPLKADICLRVYEHRPVSPRFVGGPFPLVARRIFANCPFFALMNLNGLHGFCKPYGC